MERLKTFDEFKWHYRNLYILNKAKFDSIRKYKNLRDQDILYFVYNDENFRNLLESDIDDSLKNQADFNLFKDLFYDDCMEKNMPELVGMKKVISRERLNYLQENKDEILRQAEMIIKYGDFSKELEQLKKNRQELDNKQSVSNYNSKTHNNTYINSNSKINKKPKVIDNSIYDVFYDVPEVWDDTDLEYYKSFIRHKKYKFHYWFGLLAWMTSCFWGPFLVGILKGAIDNINSAIPIENLWVIGIMYVLAFSFTMPVTIPLSFFIGGFVHPAFLKFVMFDEKHPYDDSMMKKLHHSKNQEQMNKFALGASMISRGKRR